MTVMAMILGMTDMTCDPRLIWKPVNPLTILFYAGYTVLCLMPLGLELWMEHQLLKLASRTAFRKGTSTYCGYENAVEPGMWVGGIVGLKSILGVRNREKVLQIMEELQKLGYVTYTLEPGTKILTYRITDWVLKCSGAECCDGVVYITDGYGFLCMPRNITERLAEQGRVYDESDAWLDLWCHTVFRDYGNAFSFLDGDLWRLFRFREAILDREGSFRVVCFQKQIPFLKSYLGDKVTLSTVKMEAVERVFRIEGKCLL